MPEGAIGSYVIKGGVQGRARLGVLSRALASSTAWLLDRIGPIADATAVDAACGGGDVAFTLAERVGPGGSVLGFDLDETKLTLARAEAAERGLGNVRFVTGDVLDQWPIADAGLVYARFILTHVHDPDLLLQRARQILRPGGILAAEDIDFAGCFRDPACPALDRADELYVKAVQQRGADPFIGRRLQRLIETAGFVAVESALVQPYGRQGEAKEMAALTFHAIADTLAADGHVTREEVAELAAEIDAFTARPDSTIAMPRIFQVWGTWPD